MGTRTITKTTQLYVGDTQEPLAVRVKKFGNAVDLEAVDAVKFRMLKNDGTEGEPDYNATPKIALTDSNITVQPTRGFIANATTDYLYSVGHGVRNGDEIEVQEGTTLPGGLAENTRYIATNCDPNYFQLADRTTSEAIDISSAGTNDNTFKIIGHFLYQWQSADVNTAGLYGAWVVTEDSSKVDTYPNDDYGIMIIMVTA
jgi:hypothetical protein